MMLFHSRTMKCLDNVMVNAQMAFQYQHHQVLPRVSLKNTQWDGKDLYQKNFQIERTRLGISFILTNPIAAHMIFHLHLDQIRLIIYHFLLTLPIQAMDFHNTMFILSSVILREKLHTNIFLIRLIF